MAMEQLSQQSEIWYLCCLTTWPQTLQEEGFDPSMKICYQCNEAMPLQMQYTSRREPYEEVRCNY